MPGKVHFTPEMARPHTISYSIFLSVPSTHEKKKRSGGGGEERNDIFLWKHHTEANVSLRCIRKPLDVRCRRDVKKHWYFPCNFLKSHQSTLYTWNHRHSRGGGIIIWLSWRWKLRHWEVKWFSQQAREETFPGLPWELLYLYSFSN